MLTNSQHFSLITGSRKTRNGTIKENLQTVGETDFGMNCNVTIQLVI